MYVYEYVCVSLLGFLLLGRDTMTGNTYKGRHLIAASSQVQKLNPLSRWEHSDIQAGMAQEKLRVQYLVLKANRRRLTSRQLG